ncbi:hypothetical protein V1L52_05825 [Treponema sp. HNW]|uniref:hypothetical protein n=1 Tax=Treponema sp. HNW TaxID=3116654 RepID=UPI003D0BC510
MTKKALFFFTASCLSLFVPVPPRFGYGIVLVLCASLIVFAVIVLKAFIERLGIEKYKNFLFMLGVLALTLFLYALIGFWSPLTAFTLGFIIYIIPVSLFMNKLVFPDEGQPFKQVLRQGLKSCGILSMLGLLFFALRELLAFGTLSFPARSGLRIFGILKSFGFFPVFFWATIPGALILLAFLLVLLSVVYRRYEIKEEL